jgi:hypothetical protein
MKNLILTFVLLLSFTVIPSGNANAGTMPGPDEPMITRSHMAVGGLEVMLANLEKEATSIKLINLDSNQTYFTDVVRKRNGYSWNLKLDKLPIGRYVLKIKKGDTLRQQVILKTEAGVMTSAWK